MTVQIPIEMVDISAIVHSRVLFVIYSADIEEKIFRARVLF